MRGGIEAVARALDIDPVPDRGRFVSEVTRLVLGIPGRKPIPVEVAAERLRKIPPTVASPDVVPMPLTAATWSDAIFHRGVAPADLMAAILGDRRATLLCHGLASLDDDTLEYLGDHTAVLTDLYERNAAAFGAFAGSVRIRDGRVAPPGGDAAIPLWEAALGAKVTQPSRFVTALYAHAEGRTAYLYDTIGQLDSARAAFALGLWIDDPAARLEGMKALMASWAAAFGDWRLSAQPFARQVNDAATMLTRVRVEATGAPAAPASRTFWLRVFESADLPDDPAALLVDTADRPIDAAWMTKATSGGDARQRADRLDQLAFGQRVFGVAAPAGAPDVFVAVRTFPRYRMLMLTLERIGIRAPRLFALAARHGVRLTSLDGRRAFAGTAQFQGVLAMLLRMTAVGTLDLVDAERQVASLIAVPLDDDGRYAGAVARWIRQELGAALPPADTLEASLVAALSGAREGRALPAIEWREIEYRLDLAGTERRRIERVREKQNGPSIDLAVDLADAARSLSASSLAPADVRGVAARLQSLASGLPEQPPSHEDDSFPSGVRPPPDAPDVLARAIDDLTRIAVTNDMRRLSRVARDLIDIADQVMARTLVSLVYAINIGDPDGTALLVGDVSPRHDFGFGARDSGVRARAAWALPRQDVAPGVPWHVDGSLLGLEIALAPLELRRLNMDRAVAPSITSNQRDTFAASVVLLNAFALDDDTRDAISAAIENGRRKVAALRENGSEFEALADAIGMDGSRRRAARWTLAREPDRLESLFSLEELLRLGNTGPSLNLDPWGMAAMASSGCVCTEMSPPGRWRALTGRPQIGLLATAIADLNLHIARTLKVLGLPARLAKYVLGAAVQEFIDEARPTDPDDWVTLVRAAQSVPRQRIEEFVGAAAVDGPLVLDGATLASQSER